MVITRQQSIGIQNIRGAVPANNHVALARGYWLERVDAGSCRDKALPCLRITKNQSKSIYPFVLIALKICESVAMYFAFPSHEVTIQSALICIHLY